MTVVLVTGANSGLGSATVAELARRGVDVVATVRSDDSEHQLRTALERRPATGAGSVTVDRLDVTDQAQVDEVVARHRPHVVVNNAGEVVLGAVNDVDLDAARRQFDTSVLGPVRLAISAIEHGSCTRVVNVSSIVAEGLVPFTGWYAASKAALDTLSDIWRLELRPSGVQVVTVQCGAVATDVWDDAGDQVTDGDDPSTAHARSRWAELTEVARSRFTDPSVVAEIVADACVDPDPDPTVRVGFASTASGLLRCVPARLRDAVSAAALGLRR